MLAWAETERYKFKILGVTDVCRALVGVRTGYRAPCSGYGQGVCTRERVENPRVEACALRGASERGQRDVRKLARLVQTEPQRHPKYCTVHPRPMRECTRSEHETRSTSDSESRVWIDPLPKMKPCYVHVSEGLERCRLKLS